MSITTNYTFTTPGNYTYNPADIEVAGGVARLIAQNNPGQIFNQDFSSSTGFTYNAANTEFAAGQVQQIAKAYRPTYYLGTFFANYDSDINGNYGNGALTGTPTGGASVSGGKLDLTGGGKYVTYSATGNADSQQYGCFRFKFTPNYTGSPATNNSLFSIHRTIVTLDNLIFLTHNSAGNIILSVYNSAGAAIINTVNLGAWSPVSGTEYEFEFNWNITGGATRLFINGTQFGATQVNVGVRDSNILLVNIGAAYNGSNTVNGFFNDVQVFNCPQHTANYVPSAYGLSDPKQPAFYAGYGEDINGDWGNGVLSGTSVGGASVSGGELVLDQSDVRYVDYAGLNNASNAIQEGCIRVRVKPNYTGPAPITAKIFCAIAEASGNSNNEIVIFHQFTTNLLVANIRNSAGVSIVTLQTAGAWLPTAGTTYEIELNYNLNNGKSRLFVDGVLVASNLVSTGTRTSSIGLLRIGSNVSAASASNHYILDVLLFDHVQHIANYTPDWSGILPYQYYEDVITLPQFTYSGIGNIQAFTNVVTSESNAPRYVMNGQYWSGAAWVASADTWATANPIATVLANIATLPASDTMIIKIITQNNIGTQIATSDLTLTYTGEVYPVSNPTIKPIATIGVEDVSAFTASIVAAGLDEVRFVLEVNGVDKYWDGSAWSNSVGYAQSNTAAEINTNVTSYDFSAGHILNIIAYLHSDTGATTPSIDNIAITYDFWSPAGVVNTCVVHGYIFNDQGHGKPDVDITAQITSVSYNNGIMIPTSPARAKTREDGYWELELVENQTSLPAGGRYRFVFSALDYFLTETKSVPNNASADYSTLV